jgi:hypothetical protein
MILFKLKNNCNVLVVFEKNDNILSGSGLAVKLEPDPHSPKSLDQDENQHKMFENQKHLFILQTIYIQLSRNFFGPR